MIHAGAFDKLKLIAIHLFGKTALVKIIHIQYTLLFKTRNITDHRLVR